MLLICLGLFIFVMVNVLLYAYEGVPFTVFLTKHGV